MKKHIYILIFLVITLRISSQNHYVVTTVNDPVNPFNPPVGTLRWAIESANANVGLDYIDFNITGTVPAQIQLQSYLPAITDIVILDGVTQPANGYSGLEPKIIIEFPTALTGMNLISLNENASGSTIKGLQLQSIFDPTDYKIIRGIELINSQSNTIIENVFLGLEKGVQFSGNSDLNNIYGNYFGTDHSFLISSSISIRNNVSIYFISTSTASPDNNIIGGVGSQRNYFYNDNFGITFATLYTCGAQNKITNNIYDQSKLISLYGCGNTAKLPPTIQVSIPSAGISTVSGTSIAGDVIEVYDAGSTGYYSAPHLWGTTTTNLSGQWSIVINGLVDGDMLRATATDLQNNTSEFCNPVTVFEPCSHITAYQRNYFVLNSPENFSQVNTLATNLTVNTTTATAVPARTTSTYSVHLMIAEEALTSYGLAMPDWQNPVTNSVISTPTTIGLNYSLINSPISNYIASYPLQSKSYYWKVGIQYSVDANNHPVIAWSTPYKFVLGPQPIIIPVSTETYLTNDAQHTNDINWVYGISYLDEGKTSEGIAYIDGLGKSRQVQSKINSVGANGTIIAVEAAYSEEGGGSVMTLPAPIQNANLGKFKYDYRFFDVLDGGNYRDFETKDFDREIKQATGNTLKPSTPVASSSLPNEGSSVGNYYSSYNTVEEFVDDAMGYPYSYNVGYNNPLQRAKLSPAGVGDVFKLSEGKNYKHFYGKPDSQGELFRVWGQGTNKQKDKIARTITIDPEGVGYITYKDNEGKVIATALTACSAASNYHTPLVEPGMDGFITHVDPLENDITDDLTHEKLASSKFFIECDNTQITLNYSTQASAFTYSNGSGTIPNVCLDCKYDVEIIIKEESTGHVEYTYNNVVIPSPSLCPAGGVSASINLVSNVQLTLNGPANYLVTRRIKPHVDAASGNSAITEAVNAFLSSVQTNNTQYYNQFLNEVNTVEKYYVLRKEEVLNTPLPSPSSPTNSSIYAGSGSGYAGSIDALPLVGNTSYSPSVGAWYNTPTGLALDDDANLYVADFANGSSGTKVIRKIWNNGIPTTIQPIDNLENVLSINPYDIHARKEGAVEYIYVSDFANDKIYKIDVSTSIAVVIGSAADGFDEPKGLSENPNQPLFATSSSSSSHKLFMYRSVAGVYSFVEVASNLTGGATPQIVSPTDIEVDPNNSSIIYVSDDSKQKIFKIGLNVNNGYSGTVLDTYGSGATGYANDLIASNASFNGPSSLLYLNSFGASYNPVLLVTDAKNNCIRMIELAGTNAVSTISGDQPIGDIEGFGSTARYSSPHGLTGSATNLFLADKNNNRIKRLAYNFAPTQVCTTNCTSLQNYPDEVELVTTGSNKIIGMDGDYDGLNLHVYEIGDESYNVTSFGAPQPVTITGTPDAVYNDFVAAYQQHFQNSPTVLSMDIIPVTTSFAPSGTNNGFNISSSQLPSLNQITHQLSSSIHDYVLLKVKITNPSCESQCAPITNTLTCTDQCTQQYQALQADITSQYNSIVNRPLPHSTYGTMGNLTLEQLINSAYPSGHSFHLLTNYQYGELSDADQVLYDAFDQKMQAYSLFNMTECLNTCNGVPRTPCEICAPNYYTSVMANMDEIMQGAEYIFDNWGVDLVAPIDPAGFFPWTYADLHPPTVPPTTPPTTSINSDIQNALGNHLFNFISEQLLLGNNTLLIPKSRWAWAQNNSTDLQVAIANCTTCSTPTITIGATTVSCNQPASPISLQYFPLFLVPVLNSANASAIDEFEHCVAFASNDNVLLSEYLCEQNVNNITASCEQSAGPEPSDNTSPAWTAWNNAVQTCINGFSPCVTTVGPEPSPTNSPAWTTWNNAMQACLATTPLCNPATVIDQYKRDIVVQALLTVYTGVNDGAIVASTANTILTSTVTTSVPPALPTFLDDGVFSMSIEQTQIFMESYITELQCKLNCQAALQNEYQTWLNQLIQQTTNQIQQNYYQQCILNVDDEMDISYSSSFYHYTLYNYDYANNLVGTFPPEGIDYVNPDGTEIASHTLPSTYKNTSLYTLEASTPDEGTTTYYYDKFGRLRFSQNAEQKQRGILTFKTIFSYIKYDNESRVIETGEFRGKLFINLPNLALTSAPTFPTAPSATFDETTMQYDQGYLTTNAPHTDYNQTNAYPSNRLTCATNIVSGAKSYYGYDAHGRVKYIVQEYAGYGTGNNKYKTTDYDYKNLTSRVESITYQKRTPQETFIHKYIYDDDYRLTKTEVSRNGTTWLNAAEYNYYLHGPLKTTGLGDNAQEIDLIYNINGWLKAINNPAYLSSNPTATNESGATNSAFAPDVFAEAINYYSGDYKRNNNGLNLQANTLNSPQAGTHLNVNKKDLYNGNITNTISYTAFDVKNAMRAGATNGSTEAIKPVLSQSYQYDYLNRLTNVYTEELTSNLSNVKLIADAASNVFKTTLSYDASGNIKTLERTSYNRYLPSFGGATEQMDKMTYEYDNSVTLTQRAGVKVHNKLQYVKDEAPNTPNGEDIKHDDASTYSANNVLTHKYIYDEKGRIKTDKENGVEITWNVYDKITSISYESGITISFEYNAQQQRIKKVNSNGEGSATFDYYVYDANGILMATYKTTAAMVNDMPVTTRKIEEFHMYGLGRLGTYRVDETIGAAAGTIAYTKQYFEISDHLGSVRAVVKGAKTPVDDGDYDSNNDGVNDVSTPISTTPDGVIDKHIADIVQLTDYHEFGMTMQGRNYSADNYRFGYQGSEKETGVSGMYTTEYRALDVRLGRWFMPDPVVKPWQTPYCSMDNNPIALTDIMGLDPGGPGGSGDATQGDGGGSGEQSGADYAGPTPAPIKGDVSGNFGFANIDMNAGYHAQEVTIVADRGKASRKWYDFISETVKSGAYGELVNSLYDAKVDEYTKGMGGGLSRAYYGLNTITGKPNLPQEIYDKCRDEAEKEALPLLKDYWARKMADYDGWGFLEPTDMTNYYTYKAETVTTKDEGYALLTDVGFEVVNAWGLRFSIGLKTIKPAMNTKNATAGVGAGALTKVGGGGKYAFGFEKNAISLADEIGAKHLMSDANWKDSFLKIIDDPLSEIHFSLDDIDSSVMDMINNPGRSSTNWEMNQLYQNSGAFERTIFHYGGKTYKGFEAFSIRP